MKRLYYFLAGMLVFVMLGATVSYQLVQTDASTGGVLKPANFWASNSASINTVLAKIAANYTPYQITPTGTPATNVLVNPANGNYQAITLVTNAYISVVAGNASYGHSVRLDIAITNAIYAVSFASSNFVTTPVFSLSSGTINTLLFDKPFTLATNNLWRMFQLQ